MQENEKKQSRWGNFRQRLRNTYRLVIMNNETFEEIGSYRLSLMNVYILLSTIVVMVAMLVVLVIAFTPVRKYIPGYGAASKSKELMSLYNTVEEMEEELNAHRAYSENFRRILVGDVQTEDDVPDSQNMDMDSIEEIGQTEIDRQFRQEIEFEEIGQVAQEGRTTNFSPRDIPLEQMYFNTPVNGEISAGFMPDKSHYGVDVLAAKNTAIKAAMDGYIFFSDWTLETGNTIGIQHTNNIISFYKHNSALLKKVGSYVKAGEAVAIIGNTGTLTDGPHLHFELWHKGKPVNPTEYINF